MPYIGKAPQQGIRNRFIYQATAGQTSFSGSDANSLSLTYPDGEYVDVYQNGILLKPAADYTSTSGTSVVLVTGASLNDVVEIIVYDTFSIANSYTKADSDTRFVNVTGDTMTGDLTIGDASASDRKILFDGNAQDFHIGLDDSTDSLTIGLGSTLGTTSHMVIDANGHITKPLQSAFFAHADTAQSNIATSTNVDVTFGTGRFDQNGDFASSVFTAPVTGKYQFNVNIRLNAVDQAAGYYICYLVTSNKNYFTIYDPGQFAGDPDFWTQNLSVVADMDASDTAKVRLLQNGGTAQSDVDGGSGDTPSNFSGYLVA